MPCLPFRAPASVPRARHGCVATEGRLPPGELGRRPRSVRIAPIPIYRIGVVFYSPQLSPDRAAVRARRHGPRPPATVPTTTVDPVIILFGLGVGILVGLTGVGGGSLMTPLLLLVGGYSPVVAIGTDLAYGAITKTVGGWRHLRAGHVDLRLSWWLAAGSVPGSILGVVAISNLHGRYGEEFDPYLLAFVAAALMVAAGATLYRSLFRPDMHRRERSSAGLKRARSKVGTVLIGLVLGIILGMTSVGSGALVGLVLILLYRLRPRRVVGTDVFHAAVMLWAAALTHLFYGNVDLGLMAT